MNVVFMGTPDFAVGCLEVLNENYNVVGVFTQPDKPQGRKMELKPPAVKVRAQELGLTVYQPNSLKNEETYNLLKSLNPELIVVVAYGKILPKNILDLPPMGCINVHASLLPRHRGSAPIQWSIVTGDKITGVTTMYMDEGIDTGDILLKREVEILPSDTGGTLFDRLAVVGADLLKETCDALISGNLKRIKQDETLATYAPIIKKEMALIDFSKTANEVLCLIRGFNPWPCAYFMLDGKRLKVFSAEFSENTGKAGEVLESQNEFIIACGENAIKLNDVQLEGSKRMMASDMLRGKKIEKGTII